MFNIIGEDNGMIFVQVLLNGWPSEEKIKIFIKNNIVESNEYKNYATVKFINLNGNILKVDLRPYNNMSI